MLKRLAVAGIAIVGLTSAGMAQEAPFGSADEVAYANQLWQQLAAARLVGPDAIQATTYEGGTGLHTTTLVTMQGRVAVDGNTGLAIVKKNFRTADNEPATQEEVFAGTVGGPVTVMYQREAGYDPDNKDWFWAVFTPKGDVVVNPMGMNMAGKIVGGGQMPDAPFNCIACHSLAPGDDYVYLHDSVPVR